MTEELQTILNTDFGESGLALSYALLPEEYSRRGIVARRIDKEGGRTEIFLNLPGLLDWSDMGVRTGDALAEIFCHYMQKGILASMSGWAWECRKD